LGVILLEFRRDFWHQKNRVPGLYLTFSCFGTIPTCDRRSDRKTDGHMATAYTAVA